MCTILAHSSITQDAEPINMRDPLPCVFVGMSSSSVLSFMPRQQPQWSPPGEVVAAGDQPVALLQLAAWALVQPAHWGRCGLWAVMLCACGHSLLHGLWFDKDISNPQWSRLENLWHRGSTCRTLHTWFDAHYPPVGNLCGLSIVTSCGQWVAWALV